MNTKARVLQIQGFCTRRWTSQCLVACGKPAVEPDLLGMIARREQRPLLTERFILRDGQRLQFPRHGPEADRGTGAAPTCSGPPIHDPAHAWSASAPVDRLRTPHRCLVQPRSPGPRHAVCRNAHRDGPVQHRVSGETLVRRELANSEIKNIGRTVVVASQDQPPTFHNASTSAPFFGDLPNGSGATATVHLYPVAHRGWHVARRSTNVRSAPFRRRRSVLCHSRSCCRRTQGRGRPWQGRRLRRCVQAGSARRSHSPTRPRRARPFR